MNKSTKTLEDMYLHLLRETTEVFNGEEIKATKLFDEYYDYYGVTLNLNSFFTYTNEQLVGMYSIKRMNDGLTYLITKL